VESDVVHRHDLWVVERPRSPRFLLSRLRNPASPASDSPTADRYLALKAVSGQ
jgi:hypothetical protein